MRALWRRGVELVRRPQLDRETCDELSHHIELLVQQKRASGLDEREARRWALAEAGSVSAARELVAEQRTGFFVGQLAREVRYAARVLRRSPGLTLLSTLTIGAGIGLTAMLFALVDGIVLRPLPYPAPDRLVRIFDVNAQAGIDRTGAASGNLDDWRRSGAFDGLAGYYVMGRTMTVGSDPEVVITAQVSRDFFELMRVPPALGRHFTNEEIDRAAFNAAAAPIGADPVVILSHGVWVQRLGSDPAAIGGTIVLDRRPFRVVGIMPAGFAMPERGVQLWIPWAIDRDAPRDQHYLGALARLQPEVSRAQAEDMLNAVARRLGTDHPDTNSGWSVRVSPLSTEAVGDTAATLWLLLAAVALVLLIGCANVALLSLMRGLDRQDEVAVRLALGASSSRLVREFLAEATLLAVAGGAIGTALTIVGLRVLPSLAAGLPRIGEVGFDYRSLGLIAALTMLAAIVSGLPQAWRQTRRVAVTRLTATGRTTEGRDRHALRDGIVIFQVALAMVLMTGSGLLVRSVLQLRGVDSGFDPRGVLVVPIFLDTQAYNSGAKTRGYYRTLFEQLAQLPGVVAVGAATTVPTSPLGPDFERPVWPHGSTPNRASTPAAAVRMVTPGYFTALGLRVTAGRAFDDRDSPDAPRVLMVSETLARRLWPGDNAVGKQLVVDYSTAGTYPYEIVGVVGDLRFRGPRSQPLAEIYLPHAQRSYLVMNVVIKATGDPRALAAPVRAVLKSLDPQKPAHALHALEDLMSVTYERDRHAMVALIVFAAAAVFLAVLSVYGVLSQRVREQSRAIGIRMAMGADGPRIISWVAGLGLRLMTIGLGVGAVASWALGGPLEGLLFGVSAGDGVTMAVAAGALLSIGLLAALLPSWRATRIDPVQILRRG